MENTIAYKNNLHFYDEFISQILNKKTDVLYNRI